MLQKLPEDRLGSRAGASEILAHPWFANLDLEKILDRQFEPEFVPGAFQVEDESACKFHGVKKGRQVLKQSVLNRAQLEKIEREADLFKQFV